MDTRQKKIELLSAPTFVKFADKPLRLGGIVEQIPLNDFRVKTGMTDWVEGIVYDEGAMPGMSHSPFPKISQNELKQALAQIEKNTKKMVVCRINDKVGLAVFADSDMPANSILGFYSGEIIPPAKTEKEERDSHSNPYYFVLNDGNDFPAKICADKFGNLLRFFQHAPTKSLLANQPDTVTLQDYEFNNGLLKSNVLTANVTLCAYELDGHPLLIALLVSPVKKGDQLALDYGLAYWRYFEIIPDLFDLDGNALDPKSYYSKKMDLRIFTSSGDMSFMCQVENIKKSMRKDGAVHFEVDHPLGRLRFTITQEEFMQTYDKNPHASYFVIDKSQVDIKTFVRIPASHTSLQSGFFAKQTNTPKEELERITAPLLTGGEVWKYAKVKDLAMLESPSNDTMLKIVAYLNVNGIAAKISKRADTGKSVVSVSKPDCNKLKNMDVMSEQPRIEGPKHV